jgi:filamin
VDAGEAGEGNLEILVTSPAGGNVPTHVEGLGGASFGVSFAPRLHGQHTVQVTFNDEPVPGKAVTVTQ